MHLAVAMTLLAAVAQPTHVSADLTSYNPELVPAGAKARVYAWPVFGGGTMVLLRTTGLLPDRPYGAHAHTKACGPNPADSGPHYQHVQDPISPSTDPAFANPRNEIWLDFTTNRRGAGLAIAKVDWRFTERHANSVVVHAEHTHTEPGHAGTAGTRLGCVTVGF
jgi:Cu-Zn family superoxide dismutase